MTYRAYPAAASSATLTKTTTAWAPTAYSELTASTATDIAVYAITYESETAGSVDTTTHHLIEVATGAASSEVVIAQIPWSQRPDTIAAYFLRPSTISLWENI